jgi:hypothetical protein
MAQVKNTLAAKVNPPEAKIQYATLYDDDDDDDNNNNNNNNNNNVF